MASTRHVALFVNGPGRMRGRLEWFGIAYDAEHAVRQLSEELGCEVPGDSVTAVLIDVVTKRSGADVKLHDGQRWSVGGWVVELVDVEGPTDIYQRQTELDHDLELKHLVAEAIRAPRWSPS